MRRKMNQRGGIVAFSVIAAIVGAAIFVSSSNESLLGRLRQVFIWIDIAMYSIATWSYSIFYEVSSSSLLSSLNLSAASQRLYTLLGIFMLFRLAFSFIKFIINPEGMEKGTSKLLSNLAISLALIVSVPWIFNRAFALQTYIMDSNVIGNLILGINNSNENENTFNSSSYGQQIAFLTFSAFYHPDSSIPALSDCGNLLYYYSDNLKIEGSTLSDDIGQNGNDITKEEIKIARCVNALNDKQYVSSTSDTAEVGTLFYIASQRYSIGVLTNPAVFRSTVGNQYIVEYTALVSTACGFFLALLFLNFSFDVAVRNVKFCFLQIIAPIPIILNIEPGDAKGDKKSLSWWTKECLKTYVDLFIRVATVYFGVFLINILFGNGNSSVAGSTNTSGWFKIFMVFGILLFVKQIPDLIGKAFGIDVKGQFSLNPLKRLREDKLTGGLIGAGVGLVTGQSVGSIIRGAQAGAGGKKILENARERSEVRKRIAESNRLSPKFQADAKDKWYTKVGKRIARGAYGSVTRGAERINRTLGTHIGSDSVPTSASVAQQLRDIEEGTPSKDGLKQVNENIEKRNEDKREIAERAAATKKSIANLSHFNDALKALEERAKTQIEKGEGDAGREVTRRKGEIEALDKINEFTANPEILKKLSEARTKRQTGTLSQEQAQQLDQEIAKLEEKERLDVSAQREEHGKKLAQKKLELKNYIDGEGTYSFMTQAINEPSLDASFVDLYENAKQSAGYADKSIDGLNGKGLHKLLGTNKGEMGMKQRSFNDEQRKMDDIDEEIQKLTVEKDILQQEKRNLDANKAYTDANTQITGNPGSRR